MSKPVTEGPTRSVEIPFPGFYDSILSEGLDWVEEQFAENEADREESDYEPDYWQPEGLRLDKNKYAELVFECMDYKKAEILLAKRWVACLEELVKEELGIELGMQFEEMTSPREYNFTTDRVFVLIRLSVLRDLYGISRKEKHVRLAAMIKDRFTNRSGFCSFYSNDINEWVAKPLKDWDHNELGTLLRALLPDDGDVYDRVLQAMFYQSPTDFDDALDECLDWVKFERLKEEARDELRAFLDPDFVMPVRRCSYTKDMFGGSP